MSVLVSINAPYSEANPQITVLLTHLKLNHEANKLNVKIYFL